MKKLLLSASAFGLVAASSMVLAPSKAEAIPAFARQTGSACLACHFQEFPQLNSYGRMFKESSFTMVGDQALVEDDNLSIPSVLNATFVVRAQGIHKSGMGGTASGNANGSSTTWVIPQDQNLLIAGRAGTNTGVFIEFGGVGDTKNGGINNAQVMNSFDVGGFKMGIDWYDTSFGADAGLAVNSVYGQHSGAVGDVGGSVGAINNSGFTNSIVGIGTWLGNDMGFLQLALVAPGGSAGWNTVTGGSTNGINAANGGVNVGLKFAKLIKIALTTDLGGFDTVAGVGSVSGKVGKPNANQTAADMDMQWAYGQIQGDVGDMALGVYADYAHAKGTSNGNLLGAQDIVGAAAGVGAVPAGSMFAVKGGYNALTTGMKFDAYSLRATLEPIHGLTFGLGYGYRKTGGAAANAIKHTVTAVTAAYQFYQNMVLSVNYTTDKASGNATATNNGTLHTTTLDYLIML